ncbi:hypothetical protein V5O48_008092 [Marasmius crinis-equi]|uniref:Apple domain-containing protein n=1 Tax=Marasmius crinis-equi TaxID=585013 RepID=A0ABR3FET7_9AGAR
MRFSTFVAATAVATVPTALAASATAALQSTLGQKLTKANHYGAPIPPWQKGCHPGWYYGDNYGRVDHGIPWLKDGLICKLLDLIPFGILHCPKPYHPSPPPPPHGGGGNGGDGGNGGNGGDGGNGGNGGDGYYKQVFDGYDGAVQAYDYLTYGLVDTVDDCKAMCERVDGCHFINTYHDVNGKDGSPLLTCALFEKCHNKDEATNKGGQTQPDGSINYITDSAGFCKA